MEIFNFFKRNEKTVDKNKSDRLPIQPNELGEFSLRLSDFEVKNQRSTVTSVWIDPEFEKAIKTATKSDIKTRGKKADIIELRWYFVRIILWGHAVEIVFDPEIASKSLDDFIQKINQQLNWLTKSKNSINNVIIHNLLHLKNDDWLSEGQLPLNKEDFLKSIYPISIKFSRHAAFELEYNDGNLFGGHSINLNVSSEREITDASLL